MKTLLDYCEENEGWYDNIDHCADIICKFVETHNVAVNRHYVNNFTRVL